MRNCAALGRETCGYCYLDSRADSIGSVCGTANIARRVYHANAPAFSVKTGTWYSKKQYQSGLSSVLKSVVGYFKVYKGLVQKLVGYFAKCNRADKGTCFFAFKVREQVVQNAVA